VSWTKSILKKLMERPVGPAPTYTSIQLLRTILYLGREGEAGRKKLSEILGLGEGAVRNIVKRLRKLGLIEVGRRGCYLTEEGRKFYRELSKVLRDVGEIEMRFPWTHPHNYVVLVKNRANRLKKGLEQRDAAIRGGADAVMIITFLDGELHMPGVSNLSRERPDFAEKILKTLNPREGDVIIIAGGESISGAGHGALAAAQTLL